jgi:hypothetical protein
MVPPAPLWAQLLPSQLRAYTYTEGVYSDPFLWKARSKVPEVAEDIVSCSWYEGASLRDVRV